MTLHWLLQESAAMSAGQAWLSPGEREQVARLRFAKRRRDWLLGRWTAKCALAAVFGEARSSLARFEIRNDPEGAPQAFRDGLPLGRSISISHRDGAGLCAVAPAGFAVGCDLEPVEPHGDAFARDYFDADERARIEATPEAERTALVALLWSAKESALKALGTGLRRDTRELRVELPMAHGTPDWRPLRVRLREGRTLGGWWRSEAGRIVTVVARPEAAPGCSRGGRRSPGVESRA